MRKVVIILIIAVGIALAGAVAKIVYDRWFAPAASPDASRYPVRGIDISRHNGVIDFDRLSTSHPEISFIYIKATEGTSYRDPRFVQNYRGARQSGVAVGAYHFFRYDRDGEMQALNFLDILRRRQFDLPPVVDVEDWGNPDGHTAARIVERLRAFVSALQSEGYTPMVYTNIDGYTRLIRGNFDNLPLWISSFNDPPLPAWLDFSGRRWDIWQYSHRGSLTGIPNLTDLNVVNPSSPLFRTLQDK